MGHPQPPTPMQMNNTIVLGVVGKNLNLKATESTDMICLWMSDQSDQMQSQYYWGPVEGNIVDYWTVDCCEAHHREKRPTILTPRQEFGNLREEGRDNTCTSGLVLTASKVC